MLYLFLSSILHSLRINEAGLVVQAGQLGHELSFNARITIDSVVTSIMKSGASTATTRSWLNFLVITSHDPAGTQEGDMELIG